MRLLTAGSLVRVQLEEPLWSLDVCYIWAFSFLHTLILAKKSASHEAPLGGYLLLFWLS